MTDPSADNHEVEGLVSYVQQLRGHLDKEYVKKDDGGFQWAATYLNVFRTSPGTIDDTDGLTVKHASISRSSKCLSPRLMMSQSF